MQREFRNWLLTTPLQLFPGQIRRSLRPDHQGEVFFVKREKVVEHVLIPLGSEILLKASSRGSL